MSDQSHWEWNLIANDSAQRLRWVLDTMPEDASIAEIARKLVDHGFRFQPDAISREVEAEQEKQALIAKAHSDMLTSPTIMIYPPGEPKPSAWANETVAKLCAGIREAAATDV